MINKILGYSIIGILTIILTGITTYTYFPLIFYDFIIGETFYMCPPSVWEYFPKYTYALKHKLPDNLKPNGRYQNCVWTLWLQGEENAPPIVKTCFKSIRNYIGNRRLIILDEKSIDKYVSIPGDIVEKRKKGIISAAMFSDLVRYCLLYKYGGLWLDATVLLTNKLPAKILDSNFFMFSISRKPNKFVAANWFIYSPHPGNVVLKDLINICFEYWRRENTLRYYFMAFAFLTIIAQTDPEAGEIIAKMPYIGEQQHFWLIGTYPYSDQLMKKLIRYSYSPVHKLSYKDKELFGEDKMSGPEYENSVIRFFSRPDALEGLQQLGIAAR